MEGIAQTYRFCGAHNREIWPPRCVDVGKMEVFCVHEIRNFFLWSRGGSKWMKKQKLFERFFCAQGRSYTRCLYAKQMLEWEMNCWEEGSGLGWINLASRKHLFGV